MVLFYCLSAAVNSVGEDSAVKVIEHYRIPVMRVAAVTAEMDAHNTDLKKRLPAYAKEYGVRPRRSGK